MTSEQGDERATQIEVARKIALDQLAVRQRSAKELRQAMDKRNVPADVAEEILERFTEVGLVDDAAFAAAVTQSRARNSLRGKARIRQELREKGVDRETAEEALAELDPEEELAAALELGRRKARSMARLEPHVARRRLAGVLARRGFSSSVTAAVLAEVTAQDPVEFSTGEQ
ncbi:hypothetical protein BW730_03460 [Tessaracoccus aquimaris]|uniref:Regulatory protein RecX n=1 Tax=Tessaracoccus aquimaris TaxID=1332264 RepID=A0A1Q2CKT9_9ACTN|nr:regulatory protein RecX [Tessaracoccus aquimaris]AQP46724.1 hypothetical protein BW730_03460 [Tessaracoccus aquimaris]